jgi:outer membrane protein assembly factor BamB
VETRGSPALDAFAAGKVWVPNPAGLYQIDPATNTAKVVPIPLHGMSQNGDVNVVADGDKVYVRTSDTSIACIDARTGKVVRRFPATGGGGGLTAPAGRYGSSTPAPEPSGGTNSRPEADEPAGTLPARHSPRRAVYAVGSRVYR